MEGDAQALHLQWANLIKAHHHQLQTRWLQPDGQREGADSRARNPDEKDPPIRQGKRQRDERGAPTRREEREEDLVTTREAERQGGEKSTEDPMVALQEWQALLRAPEQASRRVLYARAMHHLATKYWDPPLNRENPSSSLPETAAAKEPRAGVGVGPAGPSSVPRRRYNDRVGLCLDCLRSYFVGIPRGPSATYITTPGGVVKELLPVAEGTRGEEEAVLFAHPPLAVSPHSKAMRRAFYAAHRRMATGREVEHVLWGIPLTAGEPTQGGGDGGGAEPHHHNGACSFPPWCGVWPQTDSLSPWGTGEEQAMRYAKVLQQHLCPAGKEDKACGSGTPTPPGSPPPPLHVLDVGSCYGPFEGTWLPLMGGSSDSGGGKDRAEIRVPLNVTSIDLEPYQAKILQKKRTTEEGDWEEEERWEVPRVLAADWLTTEIAFVPGPFTDTATPKGREPLLATTCGGGRVEAELEDVPPPIQESADPNQQGPVAAAGAGAMTTMPTRCRYRVRRVAAGSFDAVLFCLLLSYLPSPVLRYRACAQAFLALKEGGLLVVLSTRTQGSRRVPWVERWAAAIARIGFERVHIQTREKVVVLSFRKRSGASAWGSPGTLAKSEGPRQEAEKGESTAGHHGLPSPEDVQTWMTVVLGSDEAQHGLQITADHQL